MVFYFQLYICKICDVLYSYECDLTLRFIIMSHFTLFSRQVYIVELCSIEMADKRLLYICYQLMESYFLLDKLSNTNKHLICEIHQLVTKRSSFKAEG